jgi:L-aminopeptidase/D-esterase-like protein
VSADFSPFGLSIGHATDTAGGTGLTVIRGTDGPFRAAAAVLGRATGTRELDALSPRHLVDRVDAILLTGGSAYGLAAAAGVMRWMEERGRGFAVRGGVVPIVPGAVLFDLSPLGAFTARPTAAMAYEACDRARPTPIEEGSVGAGTGATVGKGAGIDRAMKGGFGCAVVRAAGTGESGRALDAADVLAVGAAVAVNALGDVRDAMGRIIAGARVTEADRSAGGVMGSAARMATGATGARATGTEGRAFVDFERLLADEGPRTGMTPGSATEGKRTEEGSSGAAGGNTTLAVVATNVALSRVELAQLAQAAGAALSRRITPVGTTLDGDVIFATAPVRGVAGMPLQVEALAIRALETAIERAVRLARGRDGIPGLADDGGYA